MFQVGAARSETWATPFGYPAEIVPLENPYSLRRGATLRVRCLVDGQPGLVRAEGAGLLGQRAAFVGWDRQDVAEVVEHPLADVAAEVEDALRRHVEGRGAGRAGQLVLAARPATDARLGARTRIRSALALDDAREL